MAVGDETIPARPSFLETDGTRTKIQPDDVRGRFVTWRRRVYALFVAFYLALPFVRVGGHPAVHIDIPARRFYLLGGAFNAQDFWLVVFLFVVVAFGLLFFTSWLGRVFCGWACPQTVLLEGVYRRIERLVDGPGARRRREMGEPLTLGKVGRWTLKQAAFLIVSTTLAHVFLAFFVPVPELAAIVLGGPRGHGAVFLWATGITLALTFDFAWFREQMCIVVCPYGRFQSVLHDRRSLIIGYDSARGEPRGRGRRRSLPVVAEAEARGDCVDCGRCAKVCPTGIDIRDGLQLECIACAQCIDACDEVMDGLKRPRGLIRYDSLEGFAGRKLGVLRPRLVLYGALALGALLGVLFMVLEVRAPFEANLLRGGGTPYVLEHGSIRDQFEVHLVNKSPERASFVLEASAPAQASVTLPQPEIELASLEGLRVPIFVTTSADGYRAPFEITLRVTERASGRKKTLIGRFIGPPAGAPAP